MAAAALAEHGLEIIESNFKETTWALQGSCRAPRSLLLVHADNPWAIDLHHSIDQKPASGAPLTRLDGSIDAYRVPGWPLHPPAATLAQPALTLHLAAHVGATFHLSASLLRLVELVLVIRKDTAAGRLDWPTFVTLARASVSLRVAFPALMLAEKLAPGTVAPFVLEACARESPGRLRRLLRQLTPATAQRLEHRSVAEQYIWARNPWELARQFAADLWPQSIPAGGMRARYSRLFHLAIRGAFTR
jgi:hypothetical protein